MDEHLFRILLFEDNAADVFLVRTALEETGVPFQLEVCADGEEALVVIGRIEAGEASLPDALLLDMNLPKYGGEEILERMRQGARGSSIPVMVLTSSDSPKDRQRAVALGVEHYFHKPADLDEYMRIGEVIRGLLVRTCGEKS